MCRRLEQDKGGIREDEVFHEDIYDGDEADEK